MDNVRPRLKESEPGLVIQNQTRPYTELIVQSSDGEMRSKHDSYASP